MKQKKSAKKFLKLLAKELKLSGGSTKEELNKAFEESVQVITNPDLQAELINNVEDYLVLLSRYISEVTVDKETPEASIRNTDEEPRDQSTDAEPGTTAKYPYNLYFKDDHLEEIDTHEVSVYKCYLSQKFDEKLTEKIGDAGEDEMLQICNVTFRSGISLEKVMQSFYRKISDVVEAAFTENEHKRLKVVQKSLLRFLLHFNMKNGLEKRVDSEEQSSGIKYEDIVAALLSLFLDLSCVIARKLEGSDLKEEQRRLVTLVNYLLRSSPQHKMDVIIQTTQMTNCDCEFLLTFIRGVLEKPSFSLRNEEVYTKYVLAVRKATSTLKGEEIEYLKKMALGTKAPKKYVKWLGDKDEEVLEEMPDNAANFKGVNITRYMLEEASEETLEKLLNLLTFDESPVEEEVEEGQQEQNRDDTVDNGEVPSVELFFIDKASSEKVPKEKSDKGNEEEEIVIDDAMLDRELAAMDEDSEEDIDGDEDDEDLSKSNSDLNILEKTSKALEKIGKESDSEDEIEESEDEMAGQESSEEENMDAEAEESEDEIEIVGEVSGDEEEELDAAESEDEEVDNIGKQTNSGGEDAIEEEKEPKPAQSLNESVESVKNTEPSAAAPDGTNENAPVILQDEKTETPEPGQKVSSPASKDAAQQSPRTEGSAKSKKKRRRQLGDSIALPDKEHVVVTGEDVLDLTKDTGSDMRLQPVVALRRDIVDLTKANVPLKRDEVDLTKESGPSVRKSRRHSKRVESMSDTSEANTSQGTIDFDVVVTGTSSTSRRRTNVASSDTSSPKRTRRTSQSTGTSTPTRSLRSSSSFSEASSPSTRLRRAKEADKLLTLNSNQSPKVASREFLERGRVKSSRLENEHTGSGIQRSPITSSKLRRNSHSEDAPRNEVYDLSSVSILVSDTTFSEGESFSPTKFERSRKPSKRQTARLKQSEKRAEDDSYHSDSSSASVEEIVTRRSKRKRTISQTSGMSEESVSSFTRSKNKATNRDKGSPKSSATKSSRPRRTPKASSKADVGDSLPSSDTAEAEKTPPRRKTRLSESLQDQGATPKKQKVVTDSPRSQRSSDKKL